MDTLYRFIGGINGEREIRFFAEICNCLLIGLQTTCCKETEVPPMENSLIAVSIALYQAVQCDERVIYCENIPDLLVLIDL